MGDRLKVYIETSFVSYLTGGPTSDAKVASDQAFTRKWWETERDKCDCFVSEAGYVCPAIMTPKTFIENQTLEAEL